MVVVFAHTAGALVGAEAGIAGGSAVLGQKLLEAVFGDQAVRRLADQAREDLNARVHELLDGRAAVATSTCSTGSASRTPPPSASARPPVRSTTSASPSAEQPLEGPTT